MTLLDVMAHGMTDIDRELLHLLALKAVWPRGAGSRRFKTELHLDRAIEQHLEKLNPGDKA